MEMSTEIKNSTDKIFNKISGVVPEIEWKIHAPLIYKINKLKKDLVCGSAKVEISKPDWLNIVN